MPLKWTKKEWIKHTLEEIFTPERGRLLSLMVALVALIVLLDIIGIINPVVHWLQSDSASFSIGKSTFTAYTIIKGCVAFLLLFWTAGIFLRVSEKRIRRLGRISSSSRMLIVKFLNVCIYFIAFIIGLNILGIDLTALAVFSGAVGIGIGFGLQKITSNFISGLILLFEKVVEEGDLVEIDNGAAFGYIRKTSGRYTLLEAFDGREIMIPNEDFITQKVINYTYSNTLGRVEIIIGVAYGSDLELVRNIMIAAAKNHPRCSQHPDKQPNCFLMDFADSAVNFQLFFWVDDVVEGKLQPRSEVMMEIWKEFNRQGIDIPYPQRDVNIRAVSENVARLLKPEKEETNPADNREKP